MPRGEIYIYYSIFIPIIHIILLKRLYKLFSHLLAYFLNSINKSMS